MPAGYDAEVAELFRDLRAATTLSEMDLAARLGTRADVVQALEHGALYALPPWPETCRVVNNYGALLNLDVRPLLRRIYAQLEAGIVELQPKAMPDVPVMSPPEAGDFGFAPGNAPAHNPLDIPWPPAPQAPPPQTARPNARPSPAPQAPWPNAAPSVQPQNTWQNAQAQPQPQMRPGGQPMPQGPRPGAAPQRPAPHQQQAPDRRAPQPRAQQAQAPQPQPQTQPRQPPPPQPHPQSQPTVADFAAGPMPEPKPKRGRSMLLKWAIGALIVSVVAFGLWFALSQAPMPTGIPGLGGSQSGAVDPDDPRSRKSDRLPNAF